MFLNPTHTKTTSKLDLEYFDFQARTTHGSFPFVKTATKLIFLYSSFNDEIILVSQTIFDQHPFKSPTFIFQEQFKRIIFIIQQDSVSIFKFHGYFVGVSIQHHILNTKC